MAATAPAWWSSRGLRAILLLPFSCLFAGFAGLRRLAYRQGWLRSRHPGVPVVVVGNLAVGGSGKTPVVLWLVAQLQQAGRNPGVISRGYGGRQAGPYPVGPQSDPADVGDEPVLIARASGVPVWIGRDRYAAAAALRAAHPEVDVLVSDDGLQHYALARDCEIVVIDPATLGNRWQLPAGPLREPLARAHDADVILLHGEAGADLQTFGASVAMQLVPGDFYALNDPAHRLPAAALAGQRLRAIAGIGRPQRFFETLQALGLQPVRCDAFPDHHRFSAEELQLQGCDALVMTEKDAIKCTAHAPHPAWVLPVQAQIGGSAIAKILEKVHGRQAA